MVAGTGQLCKFKSAETFCVLNYSQKRESGENRSVRACGNKPGSLVRAEQPFLQRFEQELLSGLLCGCCMAVTMWWLPAKC